MHNGTICTPNVTACYRTGLFANWKKGLKQIMQEAFGAGNKLTYRDRDDLP